jgi:plastocyanin
MKLGIALATIAAVIVGGAALLLAGGNDSSGGSSGSASTGETATRTTKVTVADFTFKPQAIEVKKGAKVTFTNEDSAKHTATSKKQGAFDSGDLDKGKPKSVTLKKPGTYSYFCAYHATMTATLKVDP